MLMDLCVLSFFYDSYAVLLIDTLFCSIPISMRRASSNLRIYSFFFENTPKRVH
jgi:hypothetical protein